MIRTQRTPYRYGKGTSMLTLAVFVVVATIVVSHHYSGEFTCPSKPRHCRPNLPGCVPLTIEYIAFVHIPKAGGSTIDDYLAHHGRHNLCPMSKLWPQNFCHGQYSPGGGDKEQCQMQRLGLQRMRDINPFDAFHCDTIAGKNHIDFGLIDALRPDVLERTLVVVNFRQPYDRVISSYYYLLKLDNTGAYQDLGLKGFAEHGAKGEDTNNRMTKTLAGDYCCYAQPLSETERWNRAMFNLQNRVGVVTVVEGMESSLEYLSWLMGWSTDELAMKSNANPHPPVLDAGVGVALKNANTFDEKLYLNGLIQFSKQVLAMRQSM